MLNHALLVDDSKSARFALRKLLERNGLKVDIAENAEEALGYLNDNRPDVIFMDHFMPGMDGFEAVKILKNQPATASIPVVMCTSKDGDSYMAEAQEIGAVDILSKPATSTSLEIVLSKLNDAANELLNTEVTQPTELQTETVSPEQLFEQVEDKSAVETAPADTAVLATGGLSEEEVKRLATEAAQQVTEKIVAREMADLVAQQLAGKVPEMREMVMSNFNSVVRSMLKGYIDEAMTQARQDFAEIARDETRKIAEEVSREVLEAGVSSHAQKLEDTLHREMEEHLAEVYTNIGDLKANQQLKKAAPELQQELEDHSRNAAKQVAEEILAQAATASQDVARNSAREVAEEVSLQTQAAVEAKMSSALENVNQVARTEASEIAWQKIEESQKVVRGKIGSAKVLGVLGLVAAVAAIAMNFVM